MTGAMATHHSKQRKRGWEWAAVFVQIFILGPLLLISLFFLALSVAFGHPNIQRPVIGLIAALCISLVVSKRLYGDWLSFNYFVHEAAARAAILVLLASIAIFTPKGHHASAWVVIALDILFASALISWFIRAKKWKRTRA